MSGGRSVLVVEDEWLLAEEVATRLASLGHRVIGPVATASSASHLLQDNSPDLALLDIEIGDGDCYDLARFLETMGVPFAFITGYQGDQVHPSFQSRPCLQKPLMPGQIERLVAVMLAG